MVQVACERDAAQTSHQEVGDRIDVTPEMIRDTLKKSENATVIITKLLIFHDTELTARNFSVFP